MKKYIKIAQSLGIILPVCLMASTAEAKVANVKNAVDNEIAIPQNDNLVNYGSNPIKDRIAQSFNSESTISPYQIGHTNIHANYRISHTDVHTDYTVQRRHVDQHSNTPSKHVNDHSNSKI